MLQLACCQSKCRCVRQTLISVFQICAGSVALGACVHNASLCVQIQCVTKLYQSHYTAPKSLRMEDGPLEPSACALPQDLISLNDTEEQARWNQLSEVELQQEVLRYRASLQSLARDLASAGGPANGQPLDGALLSAHSVRNRAFSPHWSDEFYSFDVPIQLLRGQNLYARCKGWQRRCRRTGRCRLPGRIRRRSAPVRVAGACYADAVHMQCRRLHCTLACAVQGCTYT